MQNLPRSLYSCNYHRHRFNENRIYWLYPRQTLSSEIPLRINMHKVSSLASLKTEIFDFSRHSVRVLSLVRISAHSASQVSPSGWREYTIRSMIGFKTEAKIARKPEAELILVLTISVSDPQVQAQASPPARPMHHKQFSSELDFSKRPMMRDDACTT